MGTNFETWTDGHIKVSASVPPSHSALQRSKLQMACAVLGISPAEYLRTRLGFVCRASWISAAKITQTTCHGRRWWEPPAPFPHLTVHQAYSASLPYFSDV